MKKLSTQNRDYKTLTPHNFHRKNSKTRKYLVTIGISVAFASMIIGSLSGKPMSDSPVTQAAAISDSGSNRITTTLHLPSIDNYDAPEQRNATPAKPFKTHSVAVKKGDTLTHIFRRVGLGAKAVHQVTQQKSKVKALTRLTPGQNFDISVTNEKELEQLVYHINKTQKLIIKKRGESYDIQKVDRNYDARISFAKGTITSSLFDAANKAGLSDNLTMDLAYIFGWDIDFALDIRKGDQFVVMYEELYLDGERIADGNILAAEFINQGQSYKAVRYTDKNHNSNYYSETGRSMRKAFLRSPVDFSRISSRFGKRKHPILKKRKSHKGVDYAASRGTPIKASGDGKIVWRGRKGGYGKTVIIKHGSRYSTLYAHMKSYNRKAKLGKKVKQGQVIGYVGSTGRATGPHLHYEFRVNGVHRNPLTVKLPNAASIKESFKSDFLLKSRPLIAQLSLIKDNTVAFNEFQ